MAWQKYVPLIARELLRQFGCSERLYRDVVASLLQKKFDSSWCRGTVRKQIFEPWTQSLKEEGCKFLEGGKVTDMFFNEETGRISEVICDKESFRPDAVILVVGVSTLHDIIQNSPTLCSREEFIRHLKLSSIDLLTVKLQFDKKGRAQYQIVLPPCECSRQLISHGISNITEDTTYTNLEHVHNQGIDTIVLEPLLSF